jgi:hypothetical protein
MSYIDTIKHELVGYINGLPIYHPLETTRETDWGGFDFSCSPENLVIGGGAGEHPAIVVHELGSIVASFLMLCIEKSTEHSHGRYSEPPKSTIDRIQDILFAKENNFEFCGWSMLDFSNFVEYAKSPLHATPLQEKQLPETWLKDSLGEFIFYSLPELNPFQKEIENLPGIYNWHPGYWMSNVTCPPPNYIKSKKKSLSGTSFKESGFFRWDYKYPPEI